MPRYFIEVSYIGTRYAGFQIQQNAQTIQGAVEQAFAVVLPSMGVALTGSSRTDAGVHAKQNFFHVDCNEAFDQRKIYNLNAVLPSDIVIKRLRQVHPVAHCRFDALSRSYEYRIYQYKNPFVAPTSYYYPYPLDIEQMNAAAALIKNYTDFTSFSKRNTQVKNFHCRIMESQWYLQDDLIVYRVKANRFLRGMVRALTATMLKVGRGLMGLNEFQQTIESKNNADAFFDTPAHGLCLMEVDFVGEMLGK